MSTSRIATLKHPGVRMMMALFVLSAAAVPSVASGQTASPDVRLTTGFTLTDGVTPATGFLVGGGLPSCVTQLLRQCRAQVRHLHRVSCDARMVLEPNRGGRDHRFPGTVTLEWLNLPAGVVSKTAPSVTLDATTLLCDSYGCWVGAFTPLSLAADAIAPLGGSTVTLRATSGTVAAAKVMGGDSGVSSWTLKMTPNITEHTKQP